MNVFRKSQQKENENFYDYLSFYTDPQENLPKDDNILKKGFSQFDFDYLLNNNDNFANYSKKATLMRFDPYFLNKNPENYSELELNENNEFRIIGNEKALSASHQKTLSFQNNNSMISSSSSELSFEKTCEEEVIIEKNKRNLMSSAKRIKEQFATNDSFYNQMLVELNSNKKFAADADSNKKNVDVDDNNKFVDVDFIENNKNSSLKLQEVSQERNLFKENENISFLAENLRPSLKIQSESMSKVKRNFDHYEVLKELNQKLQEKEKEIGQTLIEHKKKKNDLLFPLKMSPKKQNNNELLIKNATDKVQKMFESLKKSNKEYITFYIYIFSFYEDFCNVLGM